MKKTIKSVLLVLGMAGVVNIADAAPVLWTLDVTHTKLSFADVWGSFSYDADTRTYTDAAFYFHLQPTVAHGIYSYTDNSLSFGIPGSTGLFTLNFASPLTDAGGIVTGTGSDHGATWSFSVSASAATTPVPEPDTYAVFLAGLWLVGFVARRRSF